MRDVRVDRVADAQRLQERSRLPAHMRRGSGTGGRKPPRARMAVGADLATAGVSGRK